MPIPQSARRLLMPVTRNEARLCSAPRGTRACRVSMTNHSRHGRYSCTAPPRLGPSGKPRFGMPSRWLFFSSPSAGDAHPDGIRGLNGIAPG